LIPQIQQKMSSAYKQKIATNKNGNRICDAVDCRRHTKLKSVGDRYYCPFHIEHPQFIAVPPRHRIMDNRGRTICFAVGCIQRRNLRYARKGFFCEMHIKELNKIRKSIDPHIGNEKEYRTRLDEVRFRADFDANHVHHMRKLEKKYSF